MDEAEKRKKYKVKAPWPTLNQIPTWTQMPDDRTANEPLVIIPEKSSSKKSKKSKSTGKPTILSIPSKKF